MILRIKRYFEARLLITSTESQEGLDEKLKLSCATLMLEMVHADGQSHEKEAQKIRALLQKQFKLSQGETDELLAMAHEEKTSATDHYQFTRLINQHYTQQQKITLVEQLWHIAYADDSIDKFEEHLVRNLAEQLHVPHRHFMQSKHRASEP